MVSRRTPSKLAMLQDFVFFVCNDRAMAHLECCGGCANGSWQGDSMEANSCEKQTLFREQRGGGQLMGEVQLPGELRKGLWSEGLPRTLLRNLASLQRQNQPSRRCGMFASLQRQNQPSRRCGILASLQRLNQPSRPMWSCSSGVLQRLTFSIAHGTRRMDRELGRIAFVAWRSAGGGRLRAWRLGRRRGPII